MSDFFHSVTLDKDKCKGCINCIKRCPTEAIRVRDGKADIITERCIDCGECIRVCPHHAKKAITDPLSSIEQYAYKIALTAPSLFGQFNNIDDPDLVFSALKRIGFDEVFDVSRAAELVSDATRRLLEAGNLRRPVISSACPAVLRLIRVRFPSLINRVLQLVAPMELSARMAKDAAVAAGHRREEVGCIFLTPCPAKVTAMRMPIGSAKSEVDAAVAVKDIYPLMVNAMKQGESAEPPQSGRIGLGWAESGGEAAGLLSTDSYLAADGIENVISVLEDLEDNKYPHLEFVELDACPGGCVGGVLQVENPYIAKTKIKTLRRYMPVSINHLSESIPPEMHWDVDLEYTPVMELGKTTQESFEKYAELDEILKKLPDLDCGSCGAPTCETFAEDVVRGAAALGDCVVLMRKKMEAIMSAAGLGEEPKRDSYQKWRAR
ncbi:4Fe-4S binding protein [Ruminococcaceae bacterium OttesenSCG-928-D13]|nr:4Fe-4S binding protein [Ruminococcaceae bacterium OttesenSCG-928-D13]